MQPTIRAYVERDYDACRGLWVELTMHHRIIYDAPTIGEADPGAGFDELLANPQFAGAWVAVDGAQVIGLSGLLVDERQGELEPLIVTEHLRREGVGRRLVEQVIAEARSRGLSLLSIRPVARNEGAVRAFHRYGFRTLGHIEIFMDLRDQPHEWTGGTEIQGVTFTL